MTNLPLFAKPAPQLVECEGCTSTADPKALEMGWFGCGTSTKRPRQLAIWCRTCTSTGASTRYLTERLARMGMGRTPR